MKTCYKCKKTFRNKEYDSDLHLDQHTPYKIKGGKIRLSGADQIRIVLADMYNGWEKVIKNAKKNNHIHDVKKAEKIQKFEQHNKIDFVVCGDDVIYYQEVEVSNEQM